MYYNDSNAKNQHKSLGIAVTTYRDLSIRTILRVILKHSDVNTYCCTPFCQNNIHSMYAWPEAQLSTCLVTVKDRLIAAIGSLVLELL